MAALAAGADWRRFSNFQFFRNWGRNRGAQLLAANPAALPDAPPRPRRRPGEVLPRVPRHPANARAVDEFLKLAAARGVTVYWVLTPLVPRFHEGLARCGFDAAHEAFIRSRQARYPNLVVLDGRGTTTGPRAFSDPNHLSAGRAYAFSLGLGNALRQERPCALGAPPSRWVALPAFQPLPLPAGVEDMTQSMMALTAGGTGRR